MAVKNKKLQKILEEDSEDAQFLKCLDERLHKLISTLAESEVYNDSYNYSKSMTPEEADRVFDLISQYDNVYFSKITTALGFRPAFKVSYIPEGKVREPILKFVKQQLPKNQRYKIKNL